MQFSKHYTVAEARAMLPKIREWLERLGQLKQALKAIDKKLNYNVAAGNDMGGDTVNCMVRNLAETKAVLAEFSDREIQLKDFDRGLVDFPSMRDGREVFLCWESDDEDIEFWHEIDTGYAGRERL